MHDSLSAAPTTSMLLAALGLGAAGLLGTARAPVPPSRPAPMPALAIVEAPAIADTHAVHEPAVAAPRSDLHLVFRGGGRSYMQLDGVPTVASLRAARPSMTRSADDDATFTAIAAVDPEHVPASARYWLGKRVLVDGSCEAIVDGFALVARLEGYTDYAGIENGQWTAKLVFEQSPPVLSARLSACTGTMARDALLPAVVTLDEITEPGATGDALRRVLGTDEAADVQSQWEQVRQDGDAPEHWYDESTDTNVRVLRHPVTGARWIVVHVSRQEGCGGINANLFGLFRVGDDGALETVELRDLGDLYSIEHVIDVEGDGTLELVGKDWLGMQRIVTRASGDVVTSTSVPYFGCAC